ncbi:MAG TPA: 4Fe-4S binding protein, partial [Phycisphaerae bacterium]|nr:4Fe-4S binding protein [Phycisphaerae bacterium]
MRIAIASGKGGTGKTTVATNLAYVASLDGRTVAYVDCDVEEPNGHLFLKPEWLVSKPVTRPVPQVDETRCTQCGRCGEICQYSAIVPLGTTVLVYPELCHGCGGCKLVCPAGAITETPRQIGVLEMGWSGDIQFNRGVLNIGEAMSPPLIRQVKSAPPKTDLTLIDAPPGTSCPVIASVRGADC